MSKIHDVASVFFTAGGFLSFFRSPVAGFGRNLVEIHRSAPPQLSERLLGRYFGENQENWRREIPRMGEKIPQKIYRKAAFLYIFFGFFSLVLGIFSSSFRRILPKNSSQKPFRKVKRSDAMNFHQISSKSDHGRSKKRQKTSGSKKNTRPIMYF